MSDPESQERMAQINHCARTLLFTNPLEALAITEDLLGRCDGIAFLEALINRADLHECFSEYDEATRLYEDAILRCSAMNHAPGQARALTGLATVSYNQDRYDDVLRQLDEAASVSNAIGDEWLLAQTLKVRCYALTDMGRYNEAITFGNQALGLFKQEGDEFGEVATLLKIVDIRSEQKNNYEAKRILKTALVAAQDLGYIKAQSTALSYFANIHIREGDYKDAAQVLEESIRLNEQIGNRTGLARNYNSLAFLNAADGKNAEATNRYRQAYDISLKANDRYKQSISLLGLADISLQECRYDDAISHALKAHEIAINASNKLNIIRAGKMLYRIEKSRGDYPAALSYLEQCTTLEKELLALEQSFELHEIQKTYELDKKEKETEIERLKNVELKKAFEELDAAKRAVEREKERSDALLLNILPAEVAEELKSGGVSPARQHDEVSVLFTDFVNFTGIAETLSPQALVQELNECFTAFDEITARNGLEKIKTIGDAYMAVCGLPVPDARHAQRTVQAALEIRDYVSTRQAARPNSGFQVRIGIHSGPVVAGIVGVKKFAYDIWGDTVNTAARMEQGSEPGRVNISQSTHDLVSTHFRCAYRGEISAKNKGAMAMYFVEHSPEA